MLVGVPVALLLILISGDAVVGAPALVGSLATGIVIMVYRFWRGGAA
jgi:hypothetical protein